jgi:hypothetical protein
MWRIVSLLTLALLLFAVGCTVKKNTVQADDALSFKKAAAPTTNMQPASQVVLASFSSQRTVPPNMIARQGCVYPAGWQAYQVQDKETAEQIAAAVGLSLQDLLQANCLSFTTDVVMGRILYLPAPQQNVSAQTILPLSVSAFVVDPPIAAPGDKVRLIWQGQGPIHTVRLGTVFDGRFYEAANNLPESGFIEVTIPDDGRDTITFMVRVGSGGDREIAAQTSVQIVCPVDWFFAPRPAGCPSDLLTTTFHEQHFEHGTIIYIPALGILYVMVTGQEAVMVTDEYVPGMPRRDSSIIIPAGFHETTDSILYIWRHDAVRNALGYALDEAQEYPGMMQRTVNPSGEVIYFSASSGHVYRVGKGLVWGVIIPT